MSNNYSKPKFISNALTIRQGLWSRRPASIPQLFVLSLKELKPKVQRAAKYTPFLLIVFLAVMTAACDGKGQSGSGGDVAASVNGKNILMSEVDTLLSQQAQGQQANMSPLELAAARMQILD